MGLNHTTGRLVSRCRVRGAFGRRCRRPQARVDAWLPHVESVGHAQQIHSRRAQAPSPRKLPFPPNYYCLPLC